MQKINPFHKPTLSIQQILGSHELNGHVHFLPYPPKNYWNNFAMWICTSMQNISSFHLFILETWSISESVNRLTTPVSDHAQLKNFDQLLIYVNFYQHAKKSDYFIDLFWRYGWLNPAIWLAENILAHTPRITIFPNIRFVHEYSKQHKFSLQNKCSKN